MKTSILSDWRAVSSLEGCWNDLLGRSRADALFLTWEWIAAWREAIEERVAPFVVVVRDDRDRVVGIGPFYISALRFVGLVSSRALRVLGDYPTGAEYPDWIVDTECEPEASRAIARALTEHQKAWDYLWLPNLSGWTGALERVVEASRAVGLELRSRTREFSTLRLPATAAEYWASLSGNARSTLRRQCRQVFETTGGAFEECRAADALPELLDALVDLNHQRWTAVGQAGTFVRKPLEHRFYRSFAPRALAQGWLRLAAIRQGGALRAVQIGYVYKGTFLQLQEGFDPNTPGVGNALRSRVIERGIEEGVHTYDFLGEHTEHKRRWRAEPRVGHDLLIARPGVLRTPLLSLGVWPTGRYLRPSGPLFEASA